MGLFDKFKTQKKQPLETLAIQHLHHSDSFRGFKRIKLVNHGDADAQRNIKKLLGKGISEVTVTVKVDNNNFTEPVRFIDVAADGLHVGTFYEHDPNEYIDKIIHGSVDAAHIKLEDACDRYYSTLFIHIQ